MTHRRRIAVLVEWSRAYGRGVLRGISTYARTHGTWKIFHSERRLSDAEPSWLKNWQGDGIIARIESRRLLAQLEQKKLPTVNLFEQAEAEAIPKILTNEEAVGRLAACHLMERGLMHFAYCGLAGIPSSDMREEAFARHLAAAGHEVRVYRNPHQRHATFLSSTEEYELLCEETVTAWVRSLPKPVGLLACNDFRAHQILVTCGENGIAVPEEVAVLGIDNDELVCELCQPPLSSIELNAERVGYEASVLLDRMIGGDLAPPLLTLVDPKGVVPRQSTDVVAVADTDVAAAVHFIRERACQGIHVDEVLRHVQLSRSTLERRFARILGRSAKAEIDRVRLDRVKQLLAMTDYPLAKIAQLAGFSYVEGMCYLFKKTLGKTPGKYRKDAQARCQDSGES